MILRWKNKMASMAGADYEYGYDGLDGVMRHDG